MIRIRTACLLAVLGALLGWGAGRLAPQVLRAWKGPDLTAPGGRAVKAEVAPAPGDFRLDAANSTAMQGRDDPEHERWLDIAGNAYGSEFGRRFSYAGGQRYVPSVRVRYDRQGSGFRGRIEATGLKPNFAYQMKLRGDYARDRAAFERIGYAGRWRLPGMGTNYSDDDYRAYPYPARVEAYILFDYFVTDARGCAAKDFELNSTLHVLFNARFQGLGSYMDSPISRFMVDASSPEYYARPRRGATAQFIWAQFECTPGRAPVGQVRLPPGRYRADLVLTEESFHSYGDGGYWATVLAVPVDFEVLPGAASVGAAGGPS